MVNWQKLIQDRFDQKTVENEDYPVLNFLQSYYSRKPATLLELGSGMGRFIKKLQSFPDLNLLNITAVDKTNLENLPLPSRNKIKSDVTKIPLKDASVELVHCSHLLEHFGYPQITFVLDEILRVLKRNGYLIIRSPLMHPGFYNEIDHIRPYPPQSILQYFSNPQQQKKGHTDIKIVSLWYRRECVRIKNVISWEHPLIWFIDAVIKLAWITTGFPAGRPNGYVAIFKKL